MDTPGNGITASRLGSHHRGIFQPILRRVIVKVAVASNDLECSANTSDQTSEKTTKSPESPELKTRQVWHNIDFKAKWPSGTIPELRASLHMEAGKYKIGWPFQFSSLMYCLVLHRQSQKKQGAMTWLQYVCFQQKMNHNVTMETSHHSTMVLSGNYNNRGRLRMTSSPSGATPNFLQNRLWQLERSTPAGWISHLKDSKLNFFLLRNKLGKKRGNSQRTCYAKHRAICLGLSNLPSGRKRRHAEPRARKSHEGDSSGKASAEKSSWHTGQHTPYLIETNWLASMVWQGMILLSVQ